MADVVSYTCPECEAVLRPKSPVAPGKKIKCPKCETVFAPAVAAPRPAAKAKAAPKAAAKPSSGSLASKGVYADANNDDFHDKTPYDVMKKDENEEPAEKITFDKIRDRFPKSKRGPAVKIVVMPANFLLGLGILECISGLTLIFIGIFPMVFWDKPPEREVYINGSIWIGGGIFSFLWGSMLCFGASKMHDVDSYGWAMTGAIMGMFSFLPIGLWCIMTLNNEKVKAGFAEGKPEYSKDW